MTTVCESRTNFGTALKALRTSRKMTLRAVQEACGVSYTTVSAFEHGERAVGADVATRLASALNLAGEERERFLFAAAATRRRDRLVGYARELAPELVNFVPRVLAQSGVDLGSIDTCDIRQNLDLEHPEALHQLKAAFAKLGKAAAGRQQGEFLVINTGDREYVCALLIAPTT